MHGPGRALALVALLLLAAPAGAAAATTRTVELGGDDAGCAASPSTPCRTITKAITLSSNGDTVRVGIGRWNVEEPGERRTGILINKEITLLGAKAGVDPRPADPLDPASPAPRIPGSGEETVIVDSDQVGASKSTGLFDARTVSNVAIDGFSFIDNAIGAGVFVGQKGTAAGGKADFGGYTVTNNIFTTSMTGLYIDNSGAQSLVEHNVFGDLGPNATGASNGSGFYSSESNQIEFTENYFRDNVRMGVFDARTWGVNPATGKIGVVPGLPAVSKTVAFTRNVSVGGSGPTFASIDGVRIEDNQIDATGGLHGLLLSGDSLDDVHVLRNTFESMRGYGILLDQSVATGLQNGPVEIRQNTIINASDAGSTPAVGVGIFAKGAGGAVTVEHNRIVDNADGGLTNEDPDAPVDARNNWWGCNAGPGFAPGCGAVVAEGEGSQPLFAPWMTLTLTATPMPQFAGDRSTLLASLEHLSSGGAPAGPFFLTGQAVFGSTPLGTHTPATVPLDPADVSASSAYTAGAADPDELRTTVDHQEVLIKISRPPAADIVPAVVPDDPTPVPGQRFAVLLELVNEGNAPAPGTRLCLQLSEQLDRQTGLCKTINRLAPGHGYRRRVPVKLREDACAGRLAYRLTVRTRGQRTLVRRATGRALAGPCRIAPCPVQIRTRVACYSAASLLAADRSSPRRAG